VKVSERSANEVIARLLVSGQPVSAFLPSFRRCVVANELANSFESSSSFVLTFCLFVVSECRSVGALVEWCRKKWC